MGDQLVQLGGVDIGASTSLPAEERNAEVGKPMTAVLRRGGTKLEMTIVPVENPITMGMYRSAPAAAARLSALIATKSSRFGELILTSVDPVARGFPSGQGRALRGVDNREDHQVLRAPDRADSAAVLAG